MDERAYADSLADIDNQNDKLNCIHGKFRTDCAVCELIASLNRKILKLEEENRDLQVAFHRLKAQQDYINRQE